MVTPDKKIDSSSAEVVRSFIATWNTHDTSATMDLLDPDIVFRSPLFSSPVRGIEARRGEIENFLTSMPDFEFNLIGIAAEGDFVATELVGSGTSTGRRSYPGVTPSHQPVDTLSSGWRGSFA
jgi:limonene-1,2-epoxide hydrolase